ncbi:hypothetical protein AAHC03_020946 [Spirometra sp. Aus1]
MLTGSIFSFATVGGTFFFIFLIVNLFFFRLIHLVPTEPPEPPGAGCRSTDALFVPWITSLLFGLLEVSSAARYLIAWLAWLQPLIILPLLPIGFVLFIYSTAFVIQLYLLRGWLSTQLSTLWRRRSRHQSGGDHFECPLRPPSAQLLRRLVAACWDVHGRIFHGYELHGLEKLPKVGPAFLVYYHGTLPLDAYYIMARHVIKRNRHPVPVVDRFLFRLPGLHPLLKLFGAFEGSVEDCVRVLRPDMPSNSSVDLDEESDSVCDSKSAISVSRGEVLLISPGGVREALFADEYYSLVWGKRRGFARVAILANQPIYPVFTENVREAIRVVQFGKRWWLKLYEWTRLPFAIFYGYFPVKLRTYIGDPIYPLESETDEELADRVRKAIEEMIRRHQWTPGNLLVALLQRIPVFDRWVQRRRAKASHQHAG